MTSASTLPLRAVILAAGRGERLRPRTDDIPKPLVEVAGEGLLERLIRQCEAVGIGDVHVVVGYRSEDVRRHLDERVGPAVIHVHDNPAFDRSNNIVSLRIGLDAVHATAPACDLLLIECDVVLRDGVIEAFVASSRGSTALVSAFAPGMDGTVVRLDGTRIAEIIPAALQGEDFDFRGMCKTVNVYLLRHALWADRFRSFLTWYASSVTDQAYYETALALLALPASQGLHAVAIDAADWQEVDDEQDLRRASIMLSASEAEAELDGAHGGYWDFPVLDFAYLRNMHFPPPALVAQLHAQLHTALANYGSSQLVLDRKMAWLMRTQPRHTVALDGAAQAFPLLADLLGRTLIPTPTFGEFQAWLPEAVTYPADADVADIGRAIEEHRPTSVVVVNPNNPTGTLHRAEALEALVRAHPGVRFLVDESFLAFTQEPSLVTLVEPPANLLVLASLSKTHGVPGLRLGMLWAADAELADAIRARLPIWGVNALAEIFLTQSLKFRDAFAASLHQTEEDKQAFARLLGAIPDVTVLPGVQGNFLLARIDRHDVSGESLVRGMRVRGLLVKDVTARMGSDLPVLRLAVRLPHEQRILGEALGEALGEVLGR